MKLEKLSQLAEIVGGIAVVISLIYVGSEIRRNTTAIQLSNHQSSVALGHEWDAWMRDADFVSLYELATRDYDSLDEAQKIQVHRFIGQGFNIWEFVVYGQGSGMVEDEIAGGWDRYFQSEIRSNAVWRLHWAENRHAYGEQFQAHVDTTFDDD